MTKIKRFSEMNESLDDNKGIPAEFLKKMQDEKKSKEDFHAGMQAGGMAMRLSQEIYNLEKNIDPKDLESVAIGVVRSIFRGEEEIEQVGVDIDDIKFHIEFIKPPSNPREAENMGRMMKVGVKTFPKSSPEELKKKKEEDTEFSNAVDKRNLINALTQGFAINSQKDLLTLDQYSEELAGKIPSTLLQKYFGFMKNALSTAEQIPQDFKDQMRQQGGDVQAGQMKVEQNEDESYTVDVKAINLVVAIQEMVKGVYEILSYHGLTDYKPEKLKEVFDETENLKNEETGFIEGQKLAVAFDEFYDELENRLITEGFIFKHYKPMKFMVLSYSYTLPNQEFLNLFYRILTPDDKPFIEFAGFYKNLFKQQKESEQDPNYGELEHPSFEEPIEEPTDVPVNYGQMSQTQLQNILNNALDSGDMATVKKVGPYIRESYNGKK
jgi:hypothetical protein